MQFPAAITRTIARQALITEANSPTLLFGAGVVGMIGSTVLACRATLKIHQILDTAEADLAVIRDNAENPDYPSMERKRDTGVVLVRSGVRLARLYAPAAAVGVISVAALTKSHNILNDRNTALAAAYTAVDKAFNRYRERVVEDVGEEKDREYRHGVMEFTDTTDGKKHKVRNRVNPLETPSMYARFFDRLSPQWSRESEYNLTFLRCQQNWYNDKLKARGHVFLNEVYDGLGLERTKAGQVVGWVISEDGDNFIDFGIWDANNETAIDFVNGREGAILLDFNVDGVIYDKIETPKERARWQD